MEHIDTIVIGAGIVGLAIARALSGHNEVAVLERHKRSGQETSSRNSGVIHAGIYYPSHFLKTQLCISGRQHLYTYCDTYDIPYKRCGKLIVATTENDISTLQALQTKARDNGLSNLQWLEKSAITELEPHINAEAALLSPSTGIIDTDAYIMHLENDILSNESHILHGQTVTSIEKHGHDFIVTTNNREQTSCKQLINAAGLAAQEIAAMITATAYIPQRHLAKGHYFSYTGHSPFHHLIYPLPEENSIGLGIHATLDMHNNIRFGPDACYIDTEDYTFDETRKQSFMKAIRRYFPALDENRLQAGFTGLRPKIQSPADTAMDFRIDNVTVHGIPGLINLFGIESPGLTASLAIADHVQQLLKNHHD